MSLLFNVGKLVFVLISAIVLSYELSLWEIYRPELMHHWHSHKAATPLYLVASAVCT